MRIRACIQGFCWFFSLLVCTQAVQADSLSEYRLKTAFLYNFALFTEWPAEVGNTLNVCVYGQDPFGDDLDKLQNKKINERSIAIQRTNRVDGLQYCQLVFVARSAIGDLPRVLDTLSGQAVLTVADSSGAASQGVALNMDVVQNKVVFEANLGAARKARLKLSSKLLYLAREVWQ